MNKFLSKKRPQTQGKTQKSFHQKNTEGGDLEGGRSYRQSSPSQNESVSKMRLPNLSEVSVGIIQKKKKLSECDSDNLLRLLIDSIKRCQQLERLMSFKQKQQEQMCFIVQSLQIAIQKRDEIITQLRQENIQLKDKSCEQQEKINRSIQQQQSTQKVIIGKNQQMINILAQNHQKNSSSVTQMFQSKKKRNSQSEINIKDSIKLDINSKRLLKARTKEINYDDSLNKLMEQKIQKISIFLKEYQNLKHIKAIKGLLNSEEDFLNQMQSNDVMQIAQTYDYLQLLMHEHRQLATRSTKNQMILKQSLNLGNGTSFNDQISDITKKLTDALDCDRVQIFLLDQDKDELWSKSVKSDFVTRIQIKDDILGICYKRQQTLNIRNAKSDGRFDTQYDEIQNYETNNLMVCPILERRNGLTNMVQVLNTIGVILALNKNNGHFNDDDALTLRDIAQIISVLQQSQQQQDESILIQNSLRNMLSNLQTLGKCTTISQLFLTAEKILANIFHVRDAKIYRGTQWEIIRQISDNESENFSPPSGIIGDTLMTGLFQNIQNAYQHPNFNKKIDIDTNMPIYCSVIKSPITDIKIVFQVVNSKGIRTKKINQLDQELMELLGEFILDSYIKMEDSLIKQS